MNSRVQEHNSSNVVYVLREITRGTQSHTIVRYMLLSKKIIKSTQIGMVNPIEEVAEVDVRVGEEAVVMVEVVDMPITKMFSHHYSCNLPLRLNPLHSTPTICGTTRHHLQCLPLLAPLLTMTLFSQEIPMGPAMLLHPSLYLI